MPARNSNRRNRRQNRRRPQPFLKFETNGYSIQETSAAGPVSSKSYTYSTLCQGTLGTDPDQRLKIISASIQFNPISTSFGQQLSAQIGCYDIESGYFIPMTGLIALSTTNTKTLSFKYTQPTTTWWSNVLDTSPLLGVYIYNAANLSSTSYNLNYKITCKYHLARNTPNVIA